MDPDELGAAYLEHAGRLAGWFRRHGFSPEDAEDLVIDTFIRALRHAYQDRGLPPYAWLAVIARSVAADRRRTADYRGLRLQDSLEPPAGPGDRLGPADLLAAIAESKIDPEILAAISELPDRQRAAIALRYVDDQSIDATALKMATSADNVKKLAARGIENLRARLSDWEPYHPTDDEHRPAEGLDALVARVLRAACLRSGSGG